jgi:uncharacterized protein YyaL (SSP411 family)
MKRFALSVFCLLFIFVQVSSADFRFSPRPNKANLIKWRSWNAATIEKAKEENKPILLSLSAVWCHWCHVMDETTYSDDDVIRFINENFIPVRVDADMRPDIDTLYNQGGWPSTLVLEVDGDIIHGGTYIPAEEMVSWLGRSLAIYKERSSNVEKAEKKKREKAELSKTPASEKSDVAKTVSFLKSEFDAKHGGFSGPRKFPNPDAINFLLSEFVRTGDAEAKSIIVKTLDEMAKGEIRDAVEGGFFRYATRSDWSSPHYEKMLDLNAEIVRNYASAYQVFKRPLYRKIAIETIDYITGTLFDPKKGLFYGSQDADEKYYTAEKRKGLKSPNVDAVFYTGPNALMISALVAASGAAGSSDYLKYATRAADFMISNLYSPEDGVYRFYHNGEKGLKGLLEDNVLFGLALLDLYTATGERKYLEVSGKTGELIAKKFGGGAKGGLRHSLDTTLVEPSSPGMLLEYNSAVANYHAAMLLERLSHQDGDSGLKRAGDAALGAMGKGCEIYGPAAGVCGNALRWKFQEPFEIVIISPERPERFLREVNRVYVPEKVVRILSMKEEKAGIEKLGYPVEEALYLCFEKRCASVKKPEEAREKIDRFMKSLPSR